MKMMYGMRLYGDREGDSSYDIDYLFKSIQVSLMNYLHFSLSPLSQTTPFTPYLFIVPQSFLTYSSMTY